MVILFRPSADTKVFVQDYLANCQKTKEVARFMQLEGELGGKAATDEIAMFGKAKNWPTADEGKVFACAIDASGKELGRINLDAKSAGRSKTSGRLRSPTCPPPGGRETEVG